MLNIGVTASKYSIRTGYGCEGKLSIDMMASTIANGQAGHSIMVDALSRISQNIQA